MSQQTTWERREVKVIESYTCDGCGKVIDHEDWGESQEMLHWSMRGGYGSVFGDGTLVTLDLCQGCVKTRLGDILKRSEDEEEGIPDLTKCPRCGGPANNGHDREFPPNPYLCTTCHILAEADSQAYEID